MLINQIITVCVGSREPCYRGFLPSATFELRKKSHLSNFTLGKCEFCLILFHYCDFANVFFWFIPSNMQFLAYFWLKNRNNEIKLAKYTWKVLKNRSNEIRIRRGSPVCEMDIFNFLWLIWYFYLPLAPT